jgi:hypothetical protein
LSQRAKAHWLKMGDLNTKYFHQKANQRHRKNTIHYIKDSFGNTWQDSENIHSIFLKHFKNIFTSSNPNPNYEIFNEVKNRVSMPDYDLMNSAFTAQEVHEAIKSLKANSAPGPDGLPAMFYQKYWDIIGPDILDFILNILNNGGHLKDINLTYLCLIPKVNTPSTPSDYRPISLCNVILKIVTKTIANRVKIILPNIVKEFQSAFLPGRLITDNSLIVFETFQYLKKPRKNNNGFVGIKLDIAKAYDSLEWSFINNTLTAWGFL